MCYQERHLRIYLTFSVNRRFMKSHLGSDVTWSGVLLRKLYPDSQLYKLHGISLRRLWSLLYYYVASSRG